MKTFEERFTAWIDGQLEGDDLAAFEKELDDHPEATAERVAALRLGGFLREHPTAPPLANADFFNLQLQRRIEAESPVTSRASRREAPGFWSFPRLAWAGAFCLLVAAALFKVTIPTGSPASAAPPYFAQVVEAWPSDPSISATTVYNAEDNVTVLWLDGLDYLPSTYRLQ